LVRTTTPFPSGSAGSSLEFVRFPLSVMPGEWSASAQVVCEKATPDWDHQEKDGAIMNALQDLPMTSTSESLREDLHLLLFTHYPSLRGILACTNELTERIAREHPVSPGLMDQFQRQYRAMADVLETYLARQECGLFPLFCQLDTLDGETSGVEGLRNNLLEAMEQAAANQHETRTLVERVWTCLCDPDWGDRGALVEELIDVVEDLQEELATCVHLEKEILFPKVRGWFGQAAGR
jgi:iron-sulfur cluster repair protein YtfE (RIC family)